MGIFLQVRATTAADTATANRTALRALIVDDSPDDVELLLLELRRAGYAVEWERVETAEDALAALKTKTWDVVLSDYSMPSFSGLRMVELAQGIDGDLPVIIISGNIGEETAVEALKAGAQDFLTKGHLARLQPAIDRELREAQLRRSHRRSEAALRESENRYRHIVEGAQEGIWVIDAELKTIYLNQRMAELLGSTVEELHGSNLLDHLDPENAAQARELTLALEGGRRQLQFVRRDGKELWTSLSIKPQLENGRVTGSLLLVTDTTEQRNLQLQLMVSDRMASVGLLAAGVAHEINNPLAAVLANVELAEHRLSEIAANESTATVVAELREGLADAHEAARRVKQIVHDLRLFSRAERDVTAPVDLARILESTLRMAHNEIRHRALLVKDFSPVRPVDANESRLGQVFLNLLVNAAQAIPEGRAAENEIRVRLAEAPGDRVEVSISDSGAGMSPEVHARLFTPFFTTKPPGVGTGLGLTICHKIVTGLGGSIDVESQLGRGTTFHVFLPVATRASVAAPTPSPSVATTLRRGRILVVDDEPSIGSILRRILSPDHEVSVLLRATEAFERLRGGERFDLIFCDLMMPEMTGMDLHNALVKVAPAQARAIIFLTGGAFTPAAQAFFEAVKQRRLDKPFSLQDVQRTVREALSREG